MSDFSDVDRSPRVDGLVSYLQLAETSLAAMKSYMAVAAKGAVGEGRVLDVGCGLGFDLARLSGLGLEPVGVDFSVQMLVRGLEGTGERAVACADAARLPFPSRSFAGCRAERVLQHVADPGVVVGEIARVLQLDGHLALFEPDFGTFRVESDLVPDGSWPAALMRVRHPRIGGQLVALVEAAGFVVHNVITESSRGYAFEGMPIDATRVVDRAVQDGRCTADAAGAWLHEQRAKSAAGTFRGRWDKVLVVATRSG